MKKISVIIPVYNCEKYVESCLESVINQTYSNIEIIVINDGSTDGTLDIVNRYKEKYSNLFVYSQENAGVSAARNFGIEMSTGDFVHFIDADDVIELDFYQLAMNTINSKKVDVFCSNYYMYDSKNKYNNKEICFNNKCVDLKRDIDRLLKNILNEEFKTYIWRLIISKKNIVKFDESLKILEDELFFLNVLTKSKKIFMSDNKYYGYNIGNMGSATKSLSNMKSMMDNLLHSNEKIKIFLKYNNFDSIDNLETFDSRMAHSFCNYIEILYLNTKSFKNAKKIFREFNKEKKLKEVFKNLNYKKLSYKHRITTFLALNNIYFPLKIIYFLKRR